jgi:hypothetical protein
MAREERGRGRDRDRDDEEEPRRGRGRDRDRDDDDEGEGTKVSLEPDDAVEGGGLFGPGRATIVKASFSEFAYKQKSGRIKATANVLLVHYKREDEESKEPYGLGSGWKIKGPDKIEGRGGSGGALNKSCNAYHFLNSLRECGLPKGWLEKPSQLNGVEVVLGMKPIERDFKDERGTQKKSILVVSKVVDAPWMDETEKKGKSKKDKDDEDEDRDEKPSRRSARRDKDEDEEERPTRKSKPNGKADEDEKTDVDEESAEALIEALADGPIGVDDVEEAIRKRLKGNPQRHAIAARCAEDAFLKKELGWMFNEKKERVELD